MKYMIDFLKKIPMFAKLSDEDLAFLEKRVKIIDLEPNQVLFNEGESGSSAYLIQDGEIEIFKKANSRDVLLAVRTAGELLGEMSILEQNPRSASARSKGKSVLLMIDGKVFNDLLDHSANASKAVFHSMLLRWRSMESLMKQSEKMAMLGTLTAGIAHELNNPVSAIKSNSLRLKGEITTFIETQKQMNLVNLTDEQLEKINNLREQLIEKSISQLDLNPSIRNDREFELETWLENQGIENSYELAPILVNVDMTVTSLLEIFQIFGKGHFSAVVQWLAHTSSVYNMLTEISSASDRMSEIVKGLKEYSYLDQAPIQEIDIHKGIDNSIILLKHKAKSKNIKVTREYDTTIPHIQAYGNELNQVWTNLMDNAIDALNENGEIKITTKNMGDWISVEIQDNGSGIPESIKHKVFDPFFTTKPPGKGTGLGLDISYKIITQKHHGDIQLYSQPGFTSFQIIIPKHLDEVIKNKTLIPTSILPVNEYFTQIVNQTNSIAVVHVSPIKEQPNCYIPEFFLEKGFKVYLIHPTLESWNGHKVFRSLKEVSDPIDLVLLFESSDVAVKTVEIAIKKTVKTIWMQEGIINLEAAEAARKEHLNVVMDKCFYTTWKRINEYKNKNLNSET